MFLCYVASSYYKDNFCKLVYSDDFFRRNFIRMLLVLLINITAQKAKSDMENYTDYCVIVQCL